MEQRILTIETRNTRGKNACRRLRAEAKIPAVIYGKGMDSVAVTVNRKELETAIAGEGGINNLITLKGAGEFDGKFVIVADLTRNCLKGKMLHVDLHQVNLLDKVKVKVPVSISSVAKGVKDGGIQDIIMHEIEIECLPTQIPEHVEVDVSNLEIGESLHVSDLRLAPGMKVLDDPTAAIVNILGKAKEAEEVAEAAE
ncbi:MAG: 50S ribosomal protein L25 [Deltaproteobacteria bacterium]|nr:50S ribosomal protein L25 [Deltaproteobacteria bacterium]